jgi:predicted nuclease with TOPRIM domain
MEDLIKMHERLASLETHRTDVIRRLEKLEAIMTTIQGLATNTAALAEAMNTMKEKVGEIATHVEELENVPKKRFDLIFNTILTTVLGALVGYLVSLILR